MGNCPTLKYHDLIMNGTLSQTVGNLRNAMPSAMYVYIEQIISVLAYSTNIQK